MAYQNRQNMHDLFKDNIHQAEGDRDRKYHERQQQLNEERASIEVLNRQLAEEERMNKAKKEAIRNAQYQEYANYMKNKYEDPKRGRSRGDIEIKIGGENRMLKRKTYDDVSNGLILNPMTEKAPERQSRELVQQTYNNQIMRHRGNSHGYNIISGAIYDGKNNNISTVQQRNNMPPQYEDYRREQQVPQDTYQQCSARRTPMNQTSMMNNPNEDPYAKYKQQAPMNNIPNENPYSKYKEQISQQPPMMNTNQDPYAQYKEKISRQPMNEDPYTKYKEQISQQQPMSNEDPYAKYKEQISQPPMSNEDPYAKYQEQPMNSNRTNQQTEEGFVASLSPEEREQYLNEYNRQKAQLEYEYQQQHQQESKNERPQAPSNSNAKEPELTEEDYKRYYEYLDMMKKNEARSEPQQPSQNSLSNQYQPQYQEPPQRNNDNPQDELTNQMKKLSLREEARNEYLANKNKNNSDFTSLLKQPIKPTTPKYTDQPLSHNDKLERQRQYKEYLDSQINAKQIYRETVDTLTKNALNNNSNENPYKMLREKNSKFKEIPSNPYSNKDYNFNNPGHESYLSSNPITNPVNSYKFTDNRRIASGRLMSTGNNIVQK